MRIMVDENVSYGLVERLRIKEHEVVSVVELSERRMSDDDVYSMILKEQLVLVTRDHHFCNPVRFPTDKTKGIIYIRHGSLKSEEEIALVERFLSAYSAEVFQGKLVTLYKDSIRIR